MIIRVGLENGIEGRSLAWALDFPGCFAYGDEGSTALMNIPQALLRYEDWMGQHTPNPWSSFGDFDIKLVEVWQVYYINDAYEVAQEGYEVNAWFRDDWRPLNPVEIDHGLQMLAWSRADLLASVSSLSAETLDTRYPNERWSVRGILGHVANAEWWYLDRLGLVEGSRQELPADVLERLDAVRKRTSQVFPGLAGALRVEGKEGEFWSPRKLLRRAIWHEMDHIQHITRLTVMQHL
jgi:uncharacterized damage-inducible protein DinB